MALSGSNDVLALASAVGSRQDRNNRLQGRGPIDGLAAGKLSRFHPTSRAAGEESAQRIGRNNAGSSTWI